MTPVLPAFAADASALKEDAPDRYIVVPGDTLWGISGRFLKDPWKWPEIWKMNQEQIKNPNRIYPGDVVVLDRTDREAQLRLVQGSTIKLSPQIRGQTLAAAAVRYPLMTLQVISLIHLAAIAMRLRGVPYRRPAADHRPLTSPAAILSRH